MQQLTIHFKNGEKKKVPMEVIEAINSQVTKPGGAPNFQFYTDENDKIFLVINIGEIAFID